MLLVVECLGTRMPASIAELTIGHGQPEIDLEWFRGNLE